MAHDKIKFTRPMDTQSVRDAIREKQNRIGDLIAVLKKWDLPSDLDGMFHRIEIGYDAERKAVMADLERYIKETNMPSYLQPDAQEKARSTVDEEMERDLQRVLYLFDNTITKDDLVQDENGNISLTPEYCQMLMRNIEKTLPDDEMPYFDMLKKMLDLYRKLNKRYRVDGIMSSLAIPLNHGEDIPDSRIAYALDSYKR